MAGEQQIPIHCGRHEGTVFEGQIVPDPKGIREPLRGNKFFQQINGKPGVDLAHIPHPIRIGCHAGEKIHMAAHRGHEIKNTNRAQGKKQILPGALVAHGPVVFSVDPPFHEIRINQPRADMLFPPQTICNLKTDMLRRSGFTLPPPQ